MGFEHYKIVLSVCVCVHAGKQAPCVYAWKHVSSCAFVNVCMCWYVPILLYVNSYMFCRACTCLFLNVCTCMPMHMHECLFVRVHTCLSMHVCVCMFICECVYMYAHACPCVSARVRV